MSEMHVHSGGLYRCCLIHCEQLVEEGAVPEKETFCRYCKAPIVRGDDGTWRWGGPDYGKPQTGAAALQSAPLTAADSQKSEGS